MDVRSREDEIRGRLADITGPTPGAAETALLGRLIRSYLTKTPGAVDRLGELLRGGSPEEVRDQAHAMKGSAANLGADTLAAVLAEVEHSSRDGVIPGPDITIGRITAELCQVQALLEGIAADYQ
jgi:HPt (histidine-containing phosphotransfer) domain-containing protein